MQSLPFCFLLRRGFNAICFLHFEYKISIKKGSILFSSNNINSKGSISSITSFCWIFQQVALQCWQSSLEFFLRQWYHFLFCQQSLFFTLQRRKMGKVCFANKTILPSVFALSDSVYTGSYNEFGYWNRVSWIMF